MDPIEQMRALVAVSDTGSFTQAGKQLAKSKALISKHISDLENRLGARLLNRTTRKVALTEVGRAYLQRARELIHEFDALEDSVHSSSASPRGRLKITAPQAFGELELMELVCGFQEAHSQIRPDIFLSDRVVDLIGEGFDVALRVTGMPDSGLIARKLCDVAVRICASPDYLARAGRPKTPAELINHACIVDSNMKIAVRDTWRMRDGASSASVRIGTVMQINSAVAVQQAVLAGRGIAACPEFAVAREIASGDLVELFPGSLDYDLALHIVYPHRLHLSAKARAFIDFTVAWYQKGAPWSRAKQLKQQMQQSETGDRALENATRVPRQRKGATG